MILNGFKFGLLLQLAIGPVCIYIVKIALEAGILAAVSGVIAAALIDAIFIVLAIIGVGSLISKSGIQTIIRYFGSLLLIYFGLGIFLGCFGIMILPDKVNTAISFETEHVFVTTLIITASNPLSILFWTGVFSLKIASENYNKREIILFATGTVLATIVFLSLVAVFFSLLHRKIPDGAITIVNLCAGLLITFFGIRTFFNKNTAPVTTTG